MNIFEPVRVGLSQLQANKMRSFLTLLGLLIGVASVTGIVALAEGLRTSVTEQLDRLGGSSLIFLSNPARFYRDDSGRWIRRLHDDHLVMEDIDRILEEVPNVRNVIPHARTNGQFRRGKVSTGSQITGATLDYDEAMDWRVERGRWINQTDMSRWRKVVILGPELATDLFGEEDPIGQQAKINGERYDVIGVMESKRIMDQEPVVTGSTCSRSAPNWVQIRSRLWLPCGRRCGVITGMERTSPSRPQTRRWKRSTR